MLDADLLDCINGLLSSFTESLEGVQLDAKNILRGAVGLSNVQLRQSVFSNLGLPLKANFNVIKKLSIKISKRSICIDIEDLLIIFTPLPVTQWDICSYNKYYINRQESLLKYLEEKTKKLLTNGLNNSFFSKMMSRFSNSLLGLLKLRVANVHIRIEDDHTNRPAVAFGIHVPLVELLPGVKSEDLPPLAQSINDIKSITHLHLKLSNVGIYIDPIDINTINVDKSQANADDKHVFSKTQLMISKCIEQLNQFTQLHGFAVQPVDVSKYDNKPTISSYLEYLPQFSYDKQLAHNNNSSQVTTDVDSDSGVGIEPNPLGGLNSSDFIALKLLDSDYLSNADIDADNISIISKNEQIDGNKNSESSHYGDTNSDFDNDSEIDGAEKQIGCGQPIEYTIKEFFDDSKPVARIESEKNYFSYGNIWHVDMKRENDVIKNMEDEGEDGVWRLKKTPKSNDKFEEFMDKISNDKHRFLNDPLYTDLYLDIYINPSPTSHLDKSIIPLFGRKSEDDNINTCFTKSLIPITPGLPGCIICIRASSVVLVINKSELFQLLNFMLFLVNYVNWTADSEKQVVAPTDGTANTYKQKWVYTIVNAKKKKSMNEVEQSTAWCREFETKYPADLVNVLRYNAAYEAIYGEKLSTTFESFFKNWVISTFRTNFAIDVLIRNICIYFGRRRAFVVTTKQMHLYKTTSNEFVHFCTELEIEKLFAYEKVVGNSTLERILSVEGDNSGIYFGMDCCLAFTSIDDCALVNGEFTRLKGGNSGVSNFITFKNDSPITIRIPNKKSLKLLSYKQTKKLPYPFVPFDTSFELRLVNNSPITASLTLPNNETISLCIDGGVIDTIALTLKYKVLKMFVDNYVVFNNNLPIECVIKSADDGDDAVLLSFGRIFIKFTHFQLKQIKMALDFFTSGSSSRSNDNKISAESVADGLNGRDFMTNKSFSRLKRVRNSKIVLDHLLVAMKGYISLSLTGIYLNLCHAIESVKQTYEVATGGLSDCDHKITIAGAPDDHSINSSDSADYNQTNCGIAEDCLPEGSQNCGSVTVNGGVCFVEVRDLSDELPLHMRQIYSGGDEVASFFWLQMCGRFPAKQHITFVFDGKNIEITISPICVVLQSRIFHLFAVTDTKASACVTKGPVVEKWEENTLPSTQYLVQPVNIHMTFEAIDIYLPICDSEFVRLSRKNHWNKIKHMLLTKSALNSSHKSKYSGLVPKRNDYNGLDDGTFTSVNNVVSIGNLSELGTVHECVWWPSEILHFSTKISMNVNLNAPIRATISVSNLYISLMKNIKTRKLYDETPNYILYPIRMDFRLSALPNPRMAVAFLAIDPVTISLHHLAVNSLLQFTNILSAPIKCNAQNTDFMYGNASGDGIIALGDELDGMIHKIVIKTNENSNLNEAQMANRNGMFSFYLSLFIEMPLIELFYHHGQATFNLTVEELKACSLIKPKLRITCAEEDPAHVIDNLPKIKLLMYKKMLGYFDQLHNREVAEFKNAFRYGTPNSLLSIELSAIISVEVTCDDFSEVLLEPLKIVSRSIWPKYNSPIIATLATSWMNVNVDAKLIPILNDLIKGEDCHEPNSISNSARVHHTDNIPSLRITNLLGCDIMIGDVSLSNHGTMPLYTNDCKLPKFTLKIDGFEAIQSSIFLPKNLNSINIISVKGVHLMAKMESTNKNITTNGKVIISSCLQVVAPKLPAIDCQLFLHSFDNHPNHGDVADSAAQKILLEGTVNVPLSWLNYDIYISDGTKSILLLTHNRLEMMMLKGDDLDESKRSLRFGGYTFRPCYTFSTCEGLKHHALEISIGNCLTVKNLLCYNLKVSQDQSLQIIPVGGGMDLYNFGNYRLSYNDFTSGEVKFDCVNKRHINFHNGAEKIQLLACPGYETPYNYVKGRIRSRVVPGHIIVKIAAFAWAVNWLNYPIVLRSRFNHTVVKPKSICTITDEMRNSYVTVQIGIGDIRRIENIDRYPKNLSKFDNFFNSFKSTALAECERFSIEPEEFVLTAKATHYNPKLSYACSIRYAPFPYNHTMILQILPRYTVHSQIDCPIIISQRNFDCTNCGGCDACKPDASDLVINPGDRVEIHPYQKWQSNFGSFFENLHKKLSLDEGVNVRLSLGAGYSPKINISNFFRIQLTLDTNETDDTAESDVNEKKMRDERCKNSDTVQSIKTIQMQISSLNSYKNDKVSTNINYVNFDLFQDISECRLIEFLPTKVPMWTIVNLSRFELLAAQYRIEKWIILPPNQSLCENTCNEQFENDSKPSNFDHAAVEKYKNVVEFSWFDPLGSKKLQLRISGTNKKITLDLKNRAVGRFSKAIIVKKSELKRACVNCSHLTNAVGSKMKIILSIDMRLVNGRRCAFIDANASEDDVEVKQKNLDLMIGSCILTLPFQFHAQVLGAGFSYSIEGSEILYMSTTMAKVSVLRNLKKRNMWTIRASLGWFQVDIHDQSAAFKTLIVPLPDFYRMQSSTNLNTVNTSVVFFETVFVDPSGGKFLQVNNIKFLALPFVINIDARFIRLLFLQLSSISYTNVGSGSVCGTPRNLADMNSIQGVMSQVKPADGAKNVGRIVFIENIEFGRLIFIVNTKGCDGSLVGSIKVCSGGLGDWIIDQLLRTMESMLYISDATIEFSPLKLRNVSGAFGSLLTMISNRYTYRGIRQFYNVLGAIDLIGNPKSVLRHFSTGALRCVRKVRTASTVLHLPQIWIPIILSAMSNVIQSFIAGVFDAIYRFTASWGQLLQSLADNWITSPIQPCKLASNNTWMGLRCGLEKAIKCFGESMWNFIFKPSEVYKLTRGKTPYNRVIFMMRSCISSLNSLVFGTISTVLALPSELSKGIVNHVQWVPKVCSIRPKKVNSGQFDFEENWSSNVGRSIGKNVNFAIELEMPKLHSDSAYHTIYWKNLSLEIYKMAKLCFNWSEVDHINKLLWVGEDSVGIYYCGKIWEVKGEDVSKISLIKVAQGDEKNFSVQIFCPKTIYSGCGNKFFIHIQTENSNVCRDEHLGRTILLTRYSIKRDSAEKPFIQPVKIKGVPLQLLVALAGSNCAIVKLSNDNAIDNAMSAFSLIANASSAIIK